MRICQLSVRELVEFVYQSGHLMYTNYSIERAQLGSRIHRMLQAQYSEGYESEVYLKYTYTLDDVTYIVDGRADGILHEQEKIIVEEIKTTTIPYDELNDQNFVHFAQAYCYAYFYTQLHHLPTIKIRLTYYQIETKQIRQFEQEKTVEELHTFYGNTLQEYRKWEHLKQEIQQQSIQALQTLQFPFSSYRQHQRKFAVAVYKSIVDGQPLFVQAPTGIGKTISTIFPALKAIGEQKTEKVFYLCAKHTTAKAAYDTLQLLYRQDLPFKTLHIVAKDHICIQAERNCDPSICPYAHNYYSKNKQALFHLLQHHHFLHKQLLQEYAHTYQVCPFELSLDAAMYMDIIIADYNYIFDPRVYLKRFFQEKTQYTLLIDEAHNLVDRAKAMYSSTLQEDELHTILDLLPNKKEPIYISFATLLSYIENLRHLHPQPYTALADLDEQLLTYLDDVISHCEAYLHQSLSKELEDALQTIYFTAVNFLRISEYYDEHFILWLSHTSHLLTIQMVCLHPRHPLQSCLAKVKSAIFFSATLSPMTYYKDVLGVDVHTPHLILPSCYQSSQMALIINDKISTRYQHRQSSLLDLIQYVYAAICAKQGNYMVFCPSYTYMQQIKEAFCMQYTDVCVHMQQSEMSEAEKQAFLSLFQQQATAQVFFCVLGGSFSEGIDMKGDLVIGVIIIGVGLPKVHPLQEFMKDHFQQINQMGHTYAYKIPGMNKVIQAAGRLIRSHHDRGVLIFIDERYAQQHYVSLLPHHLQHPTYISQPQRLHTHLLTFWDTTS